LCPERLFLQSRLLGYRHERVSGVDFSRELTWLKRLESLAWLKAVPATVLTQVLRDQDRAFANFFTKRARYPRFKKRRTGASIRFQLDQRCVLNTYRAGERLKLPGLGALKVRWSRIPDGIPKMVTLRRDPAGRYFVAFMVEEPIEQAAPSQRSVGIDLGVKDVLITSNGQKSGNPRHLRRYRRRLKWAQRRLARKQKGSQRWHKQRQRVARLHGRVHDARQDFLHKQTTALVQANGVIAIEDLNVHGMSASAKGTTEAPGKQVRQKAGLNQSILDASFSEIRRQLDYKCHWHGRVLLVTDRFAPTSKTCSGCGAVQAEMPLQIRDWSCPACGAVHDRDVNAAVNVLRFATGGEPGGHARGGWTIPSAGADGDPGVLAPDETRTQPKAAAKHPGRCAAAA
jgi:putative transposase